jgi:hypothetical protein
MNENDEPEVKSRKKIKVDLECKFKVKQKVICAACLSAKNSYLAFKFYPQQTAFEQDFKEPLKKL